MDTDIGKFLFKNTQNQMKASCEAVSDQTEINKLLKTELIQKYNEFDMNQAFF